MQLTSTHLRTIHANVTELCIRRARGKRVQVDHLVASRRADRLELAAVYFASSPWSDGYPEICEAHFVVQRDAKVEEVLPRQVSWSAYAWEITPSGKLRYLR